MKEGNSPSAFHIIVSGSCKGSCYRKKASSSLHYGKNRFALHPEAAPPLVVPLLLWLSHVSPIGQAVKPPPPLALCLIHRSRKLFAVGSVVAAEGAAIVPVPTMLRPLAARMLPALLAGPSNPSNQRILPSHLL